MKSDRPIVILGMHRSGTSLLAGILVRLGLDLGSRLIEANEFNPGGHWEHRAVVLIHDRYLKARRSNWHDLRPRPQEWYQAGRLVERCKRRLVQVLTRDFSDSRIWGIKDPRMCRLGPMWQDVFDRLGSKPGFIVLFRHPAEVAASLDRRGDGFTPGKSALLWLRHVLEGERFARSGPRLFLSYESILADWQTAVRQITEFFNIEWLKAEEKVPGIEAFVSPALRHHVAGDRPLEFPEPLARLARKAFDALNAAQDNPETSQTMFDEISGSLADCDRYAMVIGNDVRARFREQRLTAGKARAPGMRPKQSKRRNAQPFMDKRKS